MPAGVKINRSGTLYNAYVEPHVWVFVATSAATNYASLKAMDPPKGNDGSVALLVTRTAAGNGTIPVAMVYLWINDETTADNGTTILRPTSYASDATAGRWMKCSSVTG